MTECIEDRVYNNFEPLDKITQKVTDYLVSNSPNLWKLLYYTDPLEYPLSKDALDSNTIANMIIQTPQEMSDPDVSANKNFLFQIDIDEALSVAVPQVRMEIGDFGSKDRTRGYALLNFQVIIPNKQRLFLADYSDVADRRVAIVRELISALNGRLVDGLDFTSNFFMNEITSDGVGRKTGAFAHSFNKNFSGYFLTLAIRIYQR